MDLHDEIDRAFVDAARGLGADCDSAALERPRDPAHGDVATGLAMRVAKGAGLKPPEVARKLASAASGLGFVESADVAGPGFVNVTLTKEARCAVVAQALAQGDRFGSSAGGGDEVLLEFVSANPTGPLHVGHGRAAAVGDSLARILRFAGGEVTTEYYLNDRGLQADILAASLWLRVLQLRGGLEGELPQGVYEGGYLADVAERFESEHPKFQGGPVDLGGLPDGPDETAAEVVRRVAAAFGSGGLAAVRDFALGSMADMIRSELADFSVSHDSWRSEREIADGGGVRAAIEKLTGLGCTYERDGALWFRASAHGDEKDWVLVRGNGETTYFASDVAYHLDKARRCKGTMVLLVGADHHGYVPRLRAMLSACGEDPKRLEAAFVQFVSLKDSGGRVKMSTRGGRYHLLRDLVDAIGASAARLFFVLSKPDAQMDFDVDRASSASADNPVHYLRYAHARSCGLLAKWGGDAGSLSVTDPDAIGGPEARELMAGLRWMAPTVRTSARELSPHRVAHWLISLSSAMHGFYDRNPVLKESGAARDSRLALVAATRVALANGLGLLGVDAPTRM